MNNAGYQSSLRYLALPDILRTSFPLKEQKFNVKQAPASEFDEFISAWADVNEQNVDRSVWPIHHRWRVINKGLADGVFTLSEVADGFQLELPEVDTAFLEVPKDEPEVVENSDKSASEAIGA